MKRSVQELSLFLLHYQCCWQDSVFCQMKRIRVYLWWWKIHLAVGALALPRGTGILLSQDSLAVMCCCSIIMQTSCSFERSERKAAAQTETGDEIMLKVLKEVRKPKMFITDVTAFVTISLAKVNLTKPRKPLNSDLSNELQRCGHSNESSR